MQVTIMIHATPTTSGRKKRHSKIYQIYSVKKQLQKLNLIILNS